MLTARDDLLGHQTSKPYAEVSLSDTKSAMYTERFWYMGTVIPQGDIVFGLGFGYYPNRGIMDCYAAVTIERQQYNFRASRRTGINPLTPTVGPMKIDILGGLERHRLVVEPNESEVSLDLEFSSRMGIHDEGTETVCHRDRVLSEVRRFTQAGHFQGQIRVGSRTIDVSDSASVGFRDRSWGLRAEARTDESTPPVSKFPSIFYFFLCAQLETYSLHIFFKEDAPGQFRFLAGDVVGPLGSGASQKIKNVQHDLIWRANAMSQEVESGLVRITFEDGTSKELHLRARAGRLFLKGGLYGGLNGWFQGDDKGNLHVGFEQWDFDNSEHRRITRTLAEQVIEIGDGSEMGFGTLQCGVGKGYPKYGDVQNHPAQ